MLSHRGRLPAWNRPGLCKRSGSDVRKLSRDQLPPLALQTSDAGSCGGEEEEGLFEANSKALATIVQLEKNVLFLNQQHHETLEQLHKEIERLRSENRELNFKLVMCCCGGKTRTAGHRLMKEGSLHLGREEVESGTSNELGALFHDEEVRELRNRLALERTKSNRLMRIIEKKVLEKQKSCDQYEEGLHSGGSMQHSAERGGAGQAPPTLKECELVIRQLETKNKQQTHELLQIKADLRDVLYSHKWTPDAFLMARAYISEDSNHHGFLPAINPPTKTLEKAYQRVKEVTTLPALRPKVPSMVAERHRRAQAIRGRVTKSLL